MTTNEANPYVGPRPFERIKEDSARFFGRSHETQEIASLIFGHPVTLVYAQSGAGKTSLFNASVAPTLEEGGFDVLPLTRVGGVVPKEIAFDDIQNLYVFNALLKMDPVSDPRTLLSRSLSEFLEMRPRETDENGELLPRAIVFDQFEELFTYTPRDWREQRNGFFLQVVEALKADKLLRVVFVIREDFLAELDPYARNLPERLRIRYRLERLGEDAALRAIKNPLENTSRHFAPDVAEKLIEGLLATRVVDATGNAATIKGQYVEPVQLQVVCVTLWDSLVPEVTEIQEAHLKDFDVNSALSDFYRSAIEDASKETGVKESDLRNWFGKKLITPMGTRSTVFRGRESTGDIPNSAMDYLESRHIIRAEFRAGVRWYELTHDRFIEAILANNKDWFAKRRKAMGNPLTEPAQEWTRLEKDPESLLRGTLLDEAAKWDNDHPNELDELEREFLEASKSNRQKELEAKARSEKRLRALVIGLGVALVFALVAIFTAYNQATYAKEQEIIAKQEADKAKEQEVIAAANAQLALEQARAAAEAEKEARSRQLAIQAISSLKTDPQLGLLLAIEANKTQYTLEADDTLRQALQASQAKAIFGHQSRVNALNFSIDGKYLVTGDSNGIITLWDIEKQEKIREVESVEESPSSINALVFNPDGESFAIGRADGAVIIWSINSMSTTSQTVRFWPRVGLTGSVTSIAFSPDGKKLAASSSNGATLIWETDTENTAPFMTLEGHVAQVNSVAFNPAGDHLVTSSLDATAIVWDVNNGSVAARLNGHTSGVNAAIFSPDDRYIATASADTTVRVWDAATGLELALLNHTGNVTCIAFDLTGATLASGSDDKTINVWGIEDAISFGNRFPKVVLQGHEDRINSLTFSPDSASIATASADGTIRLWNLPGGELQSLLRGHTSSVNTVLFDPKGNLLATASSDNTVRLWDVQGGETQKTLVAHTGQVFDVEFNADGTLLASKGEDATFLWDFESVINAYNEGPIEEIDGPGFLFGMDFNREGNLLATASIDEGEDTQGSTVRIFDISKPAEKKLNWSHSFADEVAVSLVFSPDSNLIAISTLKESGTYKIYLWDIVNDYEIGTLPSAGSGYAFGLAFNSDGSLLAVSTINESYRGTVRLWKVSDIVEGKSDIQGINLSTNRGAFLLAFSPKANLLAGGGADGILRLWDAEAAVNNGSTTEVTTLLGHESIIFGLAFSQDGRSLASADDIGNIRVWDVDEAVKTGGSGAEMFILHGQGQIYSVAFSPDGNWLVSAGDGKGILVWPLNITNLIDVACSRVSRNFTQSEWETYFGREKKYSPTCNNLPYHPSVLEAMVEQGKDLARRDKIEEARDLWEQVNKLDPVNAVDIDSLLAEAYVGKATEYVLAGDYNRALAILRNAIELDPSLGFEPETKIAELLVNTASQYALTGDYKNAIQALNQVADFDPNHNYKLESGGVAKGEVETTNTDIWMFEGEEGQAVLIQLRDDDSGLDTYLTLLTPSGEIETNDDFEGTNSQIDYEITETGIYLIVASGYGESTGSYMLTITVP